MKTRAGTILIEDAIDSDSATAVNDEINLGWFDYDTKEKDGQLIDIGANVGCVSLYVAKLHPEWSVIAVEPNPYIYAMLCANIVRNSALNVTPVSLAVVGEDGFVDLPYAMRMKLNHTGGSSRWMDMGFVDGSIVSTARSTTLSDIKDMFMSDSAFTAMKIDVEGEEHSIVASPGSWREWNSVNNLHLDTHENDAIRNAGFSHDQTVRIAKSRLPIESKITVYSIEKEQ